MLRANILFSAISISLCVRLYSQGTSDSINFQLNYYFTELTKAKNFNGNVIVSKSGNILLDDTYNIKGESKNLAVTKKSKFIIASVSKVFIKYSILKLVELKKIGLNDKLSKHIPDFPNADKITIYHLLQHQSGLPRELNNYKDYDSLSLNKVVELAKLEKLEFEPGSQTLYSNVAYFLLHYIIDKSAPMGYFAFVEKEVLNKMKLNHTREYHSAKSITDFNGSTSIVGIVSSDGTYTYVYTGPGGGVAFDCQFPLTFTGPC